MRYVLWVVQGLLALLFLGLGTMKITGPTDEMAALMGVPGGLILFVGTVEILGALGLVLPGLLRIKTGLVPLAATGLALVTLGATVYHLVHGDGVAMASFPFAVMLLSVFVAYGRSRVEPHARPATEREAVHARS